MATSSSPGRATARTASDYGVFARRFDAAGAPQAAEFEVNTFTTNAQNFPAVALAAGGDFVVTWASNGEDGSSAGHLRPTLQSAEALRHRRQRRHRRADRRPALPALHVRFPRRGAGFGGRRRELHALHFSAGRRLCGPDGGDHARKTGRARAPGQLLHRRPAALARAGDRQRRELRRGVGQRARRLG